MDPRPKSLERARSFIQEVSRKVRVTGAYLAGSQALGKTDNESDFDIILISPDFEHVDRLDRPPPLTRLWDHSVAGLDLLCYTPVEFELRRRAATIVQDMMEYAVPLL